MLAITVLFIILHPCVYSLVCCNHLIFVEVFVFLFFSQNMKLRLMSTNVSHQVHKTHQTNAFLTWSSSRMPYIDSKNNMTGCMWATKTTVTLDNTGIYRKNNVKRNTNCSNKNQYSRWGLTHPPTPDNLILLLEMCSCVKNVSSPAESVIVFQLAITESQTFHLVLYH